MGWEQKYERLKCLCILLSAGLMALANLFEALNSKLVYKLALIVNNDLAIIVKSKSKHIDPDGLSRLDQIR